MPGSNIWALDHLVSSLGEIVKDPRVKQWFIIRYIDEDGIHIRLRLGVDAEDAKWADRDLYPKLHRMVLGIASLPVEEPMRLVTVPMPEIDLPKSAFGVKRTEYKPETDIYGGVEGVLIAERLFQISSEIALEAICADRAGTASRKDLVPALMNVALDEFRIAKSASHFLSDYVNYWSVAVPSSGSYIVTFENKCRQLLESAVPILVPDDKYGDPLGTLLAKWRQGLRETQLAYRELKGYSEALAERLLFYFIHLMNNRLGFTIVDEIYLSILVNSARGTRLSHEFA